MIISLNQYDQATPIVDPTLISHMYDLIPTLAILLAALHIVLAYFLWRAE